MTFMPRPMGAIVLLPPSATAAACQRVASSTRAPVVIAAGRTAASNHGRDEAAVGVGDGAQHLEYTAEWFDAAADASSRHG